MVKKDVRLDSLTEQQIADAEAFVKQAENPVMMAGPGAGVTPEQIVNLVALLKVLVDLWRNR